MICWTQPSGGSTAGHRNDPYRYISPLLSKPETRGFAGIALDGDAPHLFFALPKAVIHRRFYMLLAIL